MKSQNTTTNRVSESRRLTPLHATSLFVSWLSILLPGTGLATEREVYTTINRLYTFTQFGSGNVVVQTANPAPTCTKGFWLAPNDPGFKTVYALLLAAYFNQTTLRLAGDDTQIWSGSSDVYCRLTFAATN